MYPPNRDPCREQIPCPGFLSLSFSFFLPPVSFTLSLSFFFPCPSFSPLSFLLHYYVLARFTLSPLPSCTCARASSFVRACVHTCIRARDFWSRESFLIKETARSQFCRVSRFIRVRLGLCHGRKDICTKRKVSPWVRDIPSEGVKKTIGHGHLGWSEI